MARGLIRCGLLYWVMMLAGILVWTAPVLAEGRSPSWRITQESWSAADERGFGEFIERFGAADCWTLDACLKSPANPYRHTDPRITFYADCADLPYVLRAYYAWKNGLPFAYQTAMTPADGPGMDIRYSDGGNRVVGRKSVMATRIGIDAVAVLRELRSTISTGMYRHPADADDPVNFTDMYSVKLTREAVRPGTIVYDVNGHVAMVWRVEENGRILTISSHPDHSLSRSFYGRQFLRTKPELGAGFKNWRPIKLAGAKRAADGTLTGGHIEALRNAELTDFSLEQYLGTDPKSWTHWLGAKFRHEGQELDYYDYVRTTMAVGELAYRPVEEVRSAVQSLCQDIEARTAAVARAVALKIDRQPARSRLPENIYGTYGSWETYSTPSRDARLKTAFKQMRDQIETFIAMYQAGSTRLDYQGGDLAGDLLATFEEEAQSCRISYRRTDGKPVTLDLEDVMHRLYALSFDPYQCVERRWGAAGAELASCRDGPVKERWYRAEQPLRNQIDRTYDVFMGHTLTELEAGPFGLDTGRGVEVAPDVDVTRYLRGLIADRTASTSGTR